MLAISDDFGATEKDEGWSSSEGEEETAQEKRLRLAKEYLSNIETEGMFNLAFNHGEMHRVKFIC